MVFDPTEPDIDESVFPKEDWSSTVYGECSEKLPSKALEPRGLGFKIKAYVDSDHAGDHTVTRQSRTEFIVYLLNSAPIYWSSKKQGSVETSTYASEFCAMKNCCEYIRGLRYKLQMMGIPCDFPAYILDDNQSVLVNSSSKPFSVLKKNQVLSHIILCEKELRVMNGDVHMS